MTTYNVTNIENEIAISLAARVSVLKAEVMHSTGSLHTKEDVIELLDRALNSSIMTSISEIIASNKQEVEVEKNDEQMYSLEMICEAFDKLSFTNYVTIDNDSAEFQLNYNNQVELNDVEFEFDEEELVEDLEVKLNEILNKHNN
jgi:hypothetical protein